MASKDDGGPAFPRPSVINDGMIVTPEQDGMTLRDYFAARVIPLFDQPQRKEDVQSLAKWCYEIADAMIAERSK